MILFNEFLPVYEAYIEQFGHTFTLVGRVEGSSDFEIAYLQILQCLSGERSKPVTDESIGVTGEGVKD